MEQTLPGFGITLFTSASASACSLSPFPWSYVTWLRRSLHSKTLSTSHIWKTNRVDRIDPDIYKEERLK